MRNPSAVTGGRRVPGLIVKGESLREQVTRSLRWSLFTGELAPGLTFSVPSLAEQFGVSATPVREAVLDLVQQGLVVALPNKGFRVVNPSLEYLQQGMELRRLLEVPTMLAIARTISLDEIATLRSMGESIAEHERERNLKGFVEIDYEFHWRLTALCGNPLLTELIEDLRAKARVRTVPASAALGTLCVGAQEHLDLLTAMQDHDPAAVERITLSHIQHTFDGLSSAMS